jgi:transposase
MLRPSFVPPKEIRDLRALTRLRTTLTGECSRHKQRAEKVPEDAKLTELRTIAAAQKAKRSWQQAIMLSGMS